MEDVNIPRGPQPTGSGLVRILTLVASALAAISIGLNIIMQLASHFEKRPVEPDQRTNFQTGQMTLRVLRQMPGLIRQVRLFLDQLKRNA
jgi:hypothetical protein